MNIDHRQEICLECGDVPADVERSTNETLYYDDGEILILFVLLYCARCDTYIIVFDGD